VTFSKARNGKGVRDIQVVERVAAVFVRGRLRNLITSIDDDVRTGSTGVVVGSTQTEHAIDVTSDGVSVLKENERVEGLLRDGKVVGVCPTSDLYLGSAMGIG
jgi:hypothetical protein